MNPELFEETKQLVSNYMALMSEGQKKELINSIQKDFNYLSVTVCKFKRLETSPWEVGFIINEDGWIIDSKGNPVDETVWTYTLCFSYGSLTIPTHILA